MYYHFTQGMTPLHHAADNSPDTCRLLLDHHADIEAKDEDVSVYLNVGLVWYGMHDILISCY